jgi:hypothetical protein
MAQAQAEYGDVHELDPMCAAAAAAAAAILERACGLSPPLAQRARDVLLTSVRLPSQIVGAELLREYYGNGGWGVFRRLRSVTCT